MLDEDEFARWHAEAVTALESARTQAGASFYNWACFAAEQAAQLAVKALLHGIGQAPWGHDLVALGSAAAAALGPAWPDDLDDPLRSLSQYYIPTRYPDANPSGTPSDHYGAPDAERAVTLADEVVGIVATTWSSLPRDDG